MTAEIVIMNKRGVAASADSAVTVGNKTFNGANKLFQLVKDRPIGALIFNSSEINGIPVELIIKEYRSTQYTKHFNSLQEYVEDFRAFLEDFIKQHATNRNFLQTAFDDFLITTNFLKDLSIMRENLLSKPNILKIRKTRALKSKIAKCYEVRAEACCQEYQKQGLNIENIIDAFLLFINKSDISSVYTGFAIFGYGDKDIYPKTYVFYSVGFVTEKCFKIFAEEKHEADQDIIQLAQRDISDMFIFGLPYHLKRNITTIYNTVVAKLFISIGVDTPEIKDIVGKALANCAVEVDNTITGNRIANIQQSLPHLSLEDLSNLSETLIKLECLKNRASLDMESVGGEVKTAILSKHEGFHWKDMKNNV